MYSRIATKNVKKSFKDYTIYFLTLTLAVCIFYSFNSIESQKAFMEVSSTSMDYVEMLTSIISYVSVLVAVILGGLILYANNFLIKKRNKELGIYMTLGMGRGKISRILIYETIIVGIISLISGLFFGILASQGLSVLVSKLFEFEMSEYKFVISTAAIGKTVVYFGIMFFLVMLFNTYVISKYKIIDLLTVGRKTEDVKFKNPLIYLITFILCVGALGTAYKMVLDLGLNVLDIKFRISIILGVIGTALFFFSLAGFILYIVKRTKGIYFKGLNIFTIKQINSKVNTNFISMSVICLMLFITIGVLSTGFSFKNALESGLEESTPFDASAYLYVYEEDKVKSIEESMDNMGITFAADDKVAYYDEYITGEQISDIIPLDSSSSNIKIKAAYIKVSDFNEIMRLNNEGTVELAQDEVLITSNVSKLLPSIEKYMKENDTINLKNTSYKIKNKEVINLNLKNSYVKDNFLTIVINDEFCDAANLSTSIVNVNFKDNVNGKGEETFVKSIEDFKRNNDNYFDEAGFVITASREALYEENKGMTTTILFVGIYLGIVFLISSMAVLALQQLSEASDSLERYEAIRKIGASKKGINKTIFAQTLIYFSLPVILALVHSVVGIKVANDFVAMYNKPDIGGASMITAGIFVIVYIIYFYTTYTGYKNIVNSKIK